MDKFRKQFIAGLIVANPIFVLALGLCPTLAVSVTIDNGLVMSGAVVFVLVASCIVISTIRKFVPNMVRMPIFIVIIATFVTIVGLTLEAYLPAFHESLGLFLPLIVVNCIILGRAEAFASKNPVVSSIADALGAGVGFALALSANRTDILSFERVAFRNQSGGDRRAAQRVLAISLEHQPRKPRS